MARTASVLNVKNVNELWYGIIPIQLTGFALVLFLQLI